MFIIIMTTLFSTHSKVRTKTAGSYYFVKFKTNSNSQAFERARFENWRIKSIEGI